MSWYRIAKLIVLTTDKKAVTNFLNVSMSSLVGVAHFPVGFNTPKSSVNAKTTFKASVATLGGA